MLIYILYSLAYIYFFVLLRQALHMLQQNLYNENNRYLKWIWKNKSSIINFSFLIIILAFILIYYDPRSIYLLIILIYILVISKALSYEDKAREKKPLVYTARIKRLMLTVFIIMLIPLLLIYLIGLKYSFLILALLSYFTFIVVLIAMFINTPVEKIIKRRFYKMAQKKLASMNRLKVIGVTGSYGKTSTKNILHSILSVKYLSLTSQRSINTVNGNLITINNHLSKFDEVFIVEMGAYVEGEIKEITDLVHPKYGIITTIGLAHLETFGDQETILKTKMELLEALPDDGICILNADDPLQKSYKTKSKAKIIWIGIENPADVKGSKIKVGPLGTEFELSFKGEKKKYKFKTKLLGIHNVYNIIAALALAKELGLTYDELAQGVRRIKPTPHRLELKRIGRINQIDDAFNSNPSGAKAALDVLAMMNGKKVVVTPGMIELGEEEDEYNKEFGRQIADVADEVILIGREKTKAIFDGLMEKSFNEDKVHIINDVKKSYDLVNKLKDKREIYALYENDLPDTYNEGGK